MNFLFPFAAAILQAASFTLDKFILSLKRMNFKEYIGVSFPLYFLVILAAFFIVRPEISLRTLLTGNNLPLILLSSALIIVTNILYYRALDRDTLGEIQTFDMLHAIPIIIMSSLFFVDERNYVVVIPAIIAALAVVWSHWEHHRIKIKKYTLPLVIWSLVVAPVGAAILKILLQTWNPISLELIRSGFIALVFVVMFWRYIKNVTPQKVGLQIITNILTAVAWIFFFYSYQRSGIVYTVLLFSLQPFLVYLTSLFFLKEKFHPKKAVAFVVVLISIVAAHALR